MHFKNVVLLLFLLTNLIKQYAVVIVHGAIIMIIPLSPGHVVSERQSVYASFILL